jgi:transcriptional regulator with XRE-family HTH domain
VVVGIKERLGRLRSFRSMSTKELSAITGTSYSELMRLEGEARRPPSPDLIRKLADFFNTTGEYLLSGVEPTPDHLRVGFYRFYDSLSAEERQQLKYAPIQERIGAVLRFLYGSYPDLFDRIQMSARLGYTPQALDDILSGTAPLQTHLLKELSGQTGLTFDFYVRGDFFGGADGSDATISPERLSEYYRVVQEAIANQITPGALRRAIQILAIRNQEEL